MGPGVERRPDKPRGLLIRLELNVIDGSNNKLSQLLKNNLLSGTGQQQHD